MSGRRIGSVGGLRRLGTAYLRRRYAILFYTLLFTVGVIPTLNALGLYAGLLQLLLTASLLTAVVSIESSGTRRLLLTIFAIGLVVRLSAVWVGHAAALPTSLAIWTIVAILTAASDLRFALRATSIDTEHVYAALSAYVLAGLFFGVFYWVLEQFSPGSLVSTGANPEGEFSLYSAIYFSFVTLATLGYGDILPRTDIARGLAIVEAVAGQLYLAVMVARLVSLYVMGGDRQDLRSNGSQ